MLHNKPKITGNCLVVRIGLMAFCLLMSASAVQADCVLDDFEGPIRSAPDGSPLWQHYAEGAPGTVSLDNGTLRDVVGGFDGSGAGLDYLFYVRGNGGFSWPANYAQTFCKSGTFTTNTNRLTFRIKSSNAMTRNSNGAQMFEIGTYIRPHNNNDSGWQGDHYYHQADPNIYANRWVYVTLNNVPQHQVGANANNNYTANPSGVNYFDALTMWYIQAIGGGGSNSTWWLDDVRFSTVTGEPDTYVSSIMSTYTGSKYEVSWAAPKRVAGGQAYSVRYSPSSMKTNGFNSGTDGGTVNGPNDVGYTGTIWSSPNMSESASGLYVAIQPQGQSTFSEVFIPNSSGGVPPPPPPPPPPGGSACDLNGSGSTNVTDVQLCANQAIGASPCTTADINQDSQCNVIDVQRVVNSALGGPCVTQ